MSPARRVSIFHVVFFLSGFAAIVYQLVWQRVLLTLYGANAEATTVVVVAFILGLGAGSLWGGALSGTTRPALPRLFALLELSIAACGVASLSFFAWVANRTVEAPPALIALVIFALLLVPTAFMGATLPILVTHLARQSSSVGRVVGELYAVNALGSAVGAGAMTAVLLAALGQRRSVWLAAATNVLVASIVLARSRNRGAAS